MSKVGRPKLPKREVKNVISLRLSLIEKERYLHYAGQKNLKVSEWIRQELNKIVKLIEG